MNDGGGPQTPAKAGEILLKHEEPVAAPPLPPAASREAANAKLIAESGLFDAEWYGARHAEVAKSGLPPVMHFLKAGAAKGWAPSPGFDTADYLARYKDVGRTGINPLVHFILFGKAEQRTVKPADPEEVQARLIAASGLFDEAWYKATYPEAAKSRLSPARYFLEHGRGKGHNPGPKFDMAEYVASHADVRTSKINPLLHYLQFGRIEGRTVTGVQPRPERPKAAPPARTAAARRPAPAAGDTPGDIAGSREAVNAKLILESGMFDAGWYAGNYPEVRKSGLPPEIHYLRHGVEKGRAPSPGFDAAEYVNRYRDVRESGINPLVHYLLFGKSEARKVKPVDVMEVTARLVLDSGFFDEAWYTAAYPSVLKSKTSPLHHFLKHGRAKGHHPGPNFDAAEYIAAHGEVASSKVNPLVHYLQIGEAEGRMIAKVKVTSPQAESKAEAAPFPQLAEQAEPAPVAAGLKAPYAVPAMAAYDIAAGIALLETTPLFDKAWYLNKYPDVARQGLSAAEHYLRFGAAELRQPSVYFDPQYYVVEQSPEIQQTGINPLLHFLKNGRDLGRKPRALFEFVPSPGMAKPVDAACWPIVAEWGASGVPPPWHSHAELQATPQRASFAIGKTAITFGPDTTAIVQSGARLMAFMDMLGLDRKSSARSFRNASQAVDLAADFAPRAYCGFGPELGSGPSRLVDAWFSSERTLRIRLGDEAAEAHKPLVIRAFQCDPAQPGDPVLAGEALLPEFGPGFVDFALLSPLLPLLLVLSEGGGQAVEIGLLPFPSLCRGGLHYSELAGLEDLPDPIGQLMLLSDCCVKNLLRTRHEGGLISGIQVQLAGASGAEAIFQPDLRNWLAHLFGITLSAAALDAGATPGEIFLRQSLSRDATAATAHRRDGGQYTLLLPADAVPTIAALVAGPAEAAAQAQAAGSYYVADAVASRPRLSVALPSLTADFMELQPDWAPLGFPLLRRDDSAAGADPANPESVSAGHLAIRFPGTSEDPRALTFMPRAPDAAGGLLPAENRLDATEPVDAFIRASTPANLETFLRSLIDQRGIAVSRTIVEGRAGGAEPAELQAVLDRLLPGRGRLVMRGEPAALGLGTLIEGSQAASTIVADDTMVLHDKRTARTLLALLATEGTASASCVIIRESMSRKGSLLNFESGGYFPSRVSLVAAPRLILAQPDCRGAFPNMTYPVVANSAGFIVVRNSILREVCSTMPMPRPGLAAADGVEFALRALAAGYRHLCTSAVRATSLRTEPKRETADPPGAGAIRPRDWERVLGSIAIVREIY